MLDLVDDLARIAAAALTRRFPDAPPLADRVVIERSQKADLQTAAAMQLARTLKLPPRTIAEALAAGLREHPAVASVEIAGPGFVNLTLKDEWMAAQVTRVTELRPIGRDQRVILDYSSPNVAKPMHIGHIRSTIIGDALKRVLRAVGYEVIADNHLGDWGTQFGKLIVAYRRWLDAKAFESDPVAELLRLYVKFTEEERAQRGATGAAPKAEPGGVQDDGGGDDGDENDEAEEKVPELLKEARAELVRLQKGDADNVALWRRFVEVSRREFDRVYARLGVSFDETLGESFYNDRLASTVALLTERGIAQESRGATVVFFDKERDGEELPPFLVQKQDGGFLYGTTDVAALLYRQERWHPSRVLYVTDERQQLHFRQLFATARRLGLDSSLEHIWFGLMRLPEGTISTRDGKLIGLEALLDEAERRALVIAQECNPELGESERSEVARVVGLGAVKYNDLSKDRQTLVTFTWDKALALQGNTAPYLQYAYARIQSILRKAHEEGAVTIGPVAALTATERALVLQLLGFGGVVEQVARSTRPHLLCDYLFTLATQFSTFYADHPVLKAPPDVRASRLQLASAVAETMRRGLELLGIEVLDRM